MSTQQEVFLKAAATLYELLKIDAIAVTSENPDDIAMVNEFIAAGDAYRSSIVAAYVLNEKALLALIEELIRAYYVAPYDAAEAALEIRQGLNLKGDTMTPRFVNYVAHEMRDGKIKTGLYKNLVGLRRHLVAGKPVSEFSFVRPEELVGYPG